ncbi:MAG: Unknown protein [uncultured Sulfurovum sp.]|uniref:Uncharacterized protein n=1 Tax=uncultured Sulfurovum sp. TaxID=269237 RepID=A0A6S6SFW3_9BACT|nr:MAG: Unknown protein [uncultured Sulfurovum sp.]
MLYLNEDRKMLREQPTSIEPIQLLYLNKTNLDTKAIDIMIEPIQLLYLNNKNHLMSKAGLH